MTEESDLGPLTCIGCVAQVDATSDAADGWVLVPRSIDEGDDHDDSQWKCPVCATGSDEFAGDTDRQMRDADADFDG